MIKLLKNEYIKIFSKKGIYIVLGIMFAFVLLVNGIYKFTYNKDGYMKESDYTKENLNYLKEDIKKLDSNKEEDLSSYISVKTDIDINELILKYGINSWQTRIISSYLYTIVYDINYNIYAKDKNSDELVVSRNKYGDIISKLDNNDWKYFVNIELDEVKSQIATEAKQKENTKDVLVLSSMEDNINILKLKKETLEHRLKNDISYERSYLNDALNNYSSIGEMLITNKLSDKSTHGDKYQYYQNKSAFEIDKYMFVNKQNVIKQNDTRGMLVDMFDNYQIFIIVIISLIAGTIVAEEFNKGTIKQLLIKPHSRFQILLSKYLVSLSMILFSILSLLIMQLLVGGILFGYNSLSIPVAVYNFNKDILQTFNIFYYLLILTINKLPTFILMTTFIFFLGVSTTNTGISIAIGLIGYMVSSIINSIAIMFNVELLKFFPTLNWDFTIYLFGMIPPYESINFNFSILMSISYFILLIVPIFIIFKYKNIKNI